MSWTTIDRPRTLKATRALAKTFSEMEAPPHDRDLSERRMMVYRKMFANREFRPVTWATCNCKETGTIYRINGKHTSTLLCNVDTIPENFYVVIESYEADTLEDVAKLYSTFDSGNQVRTTGDINKAFAAAIPELREMSRRVVNISVGGLSYAKWQDAYGRVPAAERAELLFDCIDFVIWVNDILQGSSSRSLARVPVVGAMVLSYNKNRKGCDEFWRAVRDETGSTPTLPCRRLAKYLATMNVNNGLGAITAASSRKSQPREFFVKSIHAWNAWRRNMPTDLKYVPAAKNPVVV